MGAPCWVIWRGWERRAGCCFLIGVEVGVEECIDRRLRWSVQCCGGVVLCFH